MMLSLLEAAIVGFVDAVKSLLYMSSAFAPAVFFIKTGKKT